MISGVRHESEYETIQRLHTEKAYPTKNICNFLHVSRAGYYKWIKRSKSRRQIENERLTGIICDKYEKSNGALGYRRMTDDIIRDENINVNHKHVYRLMKIAGIKSVCRKKRNTYIKSTPQVVAENVLNREFYADKPNEKWLTDVTEFKYGSGSKLYLSAILDLGDKRIVSYEISHHNDNSLVFSTFDKAVRLNPDAHPIFHSDRGSQYTTITFKGKLDSIKATQSMSRVGRCIDNGPMESFWGTLKTESYYLHKYKDYRSLKVAIVKYIKYYNTKRYQKRLKRMSPLEFHNYLLNAA